MRRRAAGAAGAVGRRRGTQPVVNVLRVALVVLLAYRTYVLSFTDDDWNANAWAGLLVLVLLAHLAVGWRQWLLDRRPSEPPGSGRS